MYSAGVCGMRCARHSVGVTRLQRSLVLYVSVNQIIAFKTCGLKMYKIHYEVIRPLSGCRGGRVVSASGSEMIVLSSTLTGVIIYDAYNSILRCKI